MNRKETEKLITELQVSRNESYNTSFQCVDFSKKTFRISGTISINEPVFTGRIQREGYVIEKYFVKGEGDYVIPYLLMIPAQPNDKALIYLHPSGKSAEASVGGRMEWFVMNGFTVLAPDLIGIGEIGPGIFQGDADIDSISYNLWYTSILIGRSMVGIRAGDVFRLTRILKKSIKINEVYGIAEGNGTGIITCCSF